MKETTTMYQTTRRLTLALGLLALCAAPALSQVPSTVPPYNTDLGAIVTNTARVAGTFNSAQQDNLDGQGLSCVFNATANSGSPSTVFKLQGYDAASATYYDLASSGAVTTTGAPTALILKPGIVAADAASPAVAKSIPVPRKWRISQTITGANTAVTGTIGCNKLK